MWDRDAAFLVEQPTRRTNRNPTLPAGLPATVLMELRKNPAGFAERLARRMPWEPEHSTQLGEWFREWVVAQFSVSPGFDELELRARAGELELKRLRRAFEASWFTNLTPLGIKVPFLPRWESLVLRGWIDAVFPNDDPAFGAFVVDWKIDDSSAGPLQLAIYRQA